MTWLVRTLLASAQLDAGVLVLKQEDVSIRSIIQEILDSLAIQAEIKGIELINETDDIHIQCDHRWTQEALSNIIKNCLEHTSVGYIKIKTKQTNLAVDLIVQDTGCGIKEKDLPHIFDRFYKGENANADSIGIGLAFASQIICLQNGTIQATSKEDQGTSFLVRFYRTHTI